MWSRAKNREEQSQNVAADMDWLWLTTIPKSIWNKTKNLWLDWYKGLDCPTNKNEWDKVINSSKLDNSASLNLPHLTSCVSDHYLVIFSKVSYAAHAFYSKLVDSVLLSPLTQAQVIPVSVDTVIASVKKLTSNSVDVDRISVYHFKVNCPSLFFLFTVAFPNVHFLFSCSW